MRTVHIVSQYVKSGPHLGEFQVFERDVVEAPEPDVDGVPRIRSQHLPPQLEIKCKVQKWFIIL